MNLFPGDWIENNVVKNSSPYHDLAINGDISHLVEEVYADEIKKYNIVSMINEDACITILKKISDNIPHAARVFHEEAIEHLSFSLRILNTERKNILNVHYRKPHWEFEISASISEKSNLLIRTQSQILEYSLATPWGGDVLMVGYGADMMC